MLPSPLLTFTLLTGPTTGYFPCRSPISLDQLLKSPSVVASRGAETSVSASPHNKRTRAEDAGDGLGRTEEEGRTPQAKASKAGGKAPGLDRPEKTAADATSDASVMADVGPAQTEGATAAEVVASRPATDEVAVGTLPLPGHPQARLDQGTCARPQGRRRWRFRRV
jgi:hypothetical protein